MPFCCRPPRSALFLWPFHIKAKISNIRSLAACKRSRTRIIFPTMTDCDSTMQPSTDAKPQDSPLRQHTALSSQH